MSSGLQYKSEDIIGLKKNRLTIVADLGKVNGKRKVRCKCECGIIKDIRLEAVLYGTSKSCGCIQKEITSKHFRIHGLWNHPLKSVWKGMIRRCYNIKCESYSNYGGRGVRVCNEWKNNFLNFYNWAINNGWSKKLQLDKDKLSQNGEGLLYSPEYCCFLTVKENQQYKRNKRNFNYNGKVISFNELISKTKICRNTINKRLELGWTIDEIINTPIEIKFSTKKKLAS